jgi:DNA segregation ATPase FtsK/SpoIIIE, S-DNA-T family
VFEGNVPGQLDHNPLLDPLLRATDWPEGSNKPPTTWLGDPVAIKDPTAAVLRRQSGGNLLLIGQNEQQALAILAAAEISLAAQFAPTRGGRPGMRLFVLDGTPPESATAGYLGQIARLLPHESQLGGVRDTAAVMNEVGAEVARRQASGETDAPGWYVFIHDIQRFRDLRKKEDDFGFSRMGEGEQVSPSQHLTNILREGPNLGVHVLTWCDSLTNLQRTFDRQALREFELRVLFQMSPNDSSALIDSPLASRLGEQRALFHSEEQGSVEKFRPYGQPPEEWLGWVERQLKSRMPPEPAAPAPPPASERSAATSPVAEPPAMPVGETPMPVAEPTGQNGNGADGRANGDAAAIIDGSEAAPS